MGTDKRERQKTNRQLKLEEMAKEARKRKTKRRALQIGLGIPALILVVFGLVRLLADDDSTDTVTPIDTTVTTIAGDTATTLAGETATTVAGGVVPCPAEDGSSTKTSSFPAEPQMCIDTTKKYSVQVDTTLGSYTAELDPAKAPLAVNNFVFLARYHYFDGTPCHRIIPGFVVQCGDPTGTGSGSPGYKFADELPAQGEYKLGSLAMANSGPNTNGSQFFVISGPQGIALDPDYTLFGQVTEGLDVVAALDAAGTAGAGTPSTPVTIDKVTVTEIAGGEPSSTDAATSTTVSTATTDTVTTESSETTDNSATETSGS